MNFFFVFEREMKTKETTKSQGTEVISHNFGPIHLVLKYY